MSLRLMLTCIVCLCLAACGTIVDEVSDDIAQEVSEEVAKQVGTAVVDGVATALAEQRSCAGCGIERDRHSHICRFDNI